MTFKYDMDIDKETIIYSLKRITNQIYKLLPNREEGIDWINPLTTIIEELAGMSNLIIGPKENLFALICKLEGLFTLTDPKQFLDFRRMIFECLSLINAFKEELEGLE